MRIFSREATRYAVLLVVLFAIAAIAVGHVVEFVGDRIPEGEYAIVAGMLYAVSFGFMLIAGAFGLWAIQFSAAAEGRRRAGRLVEVMDSIQDGLLVVDSRGRITGSNPSVRQLADSEFTANAHLGDVFTCLSESAIAAMLESSEPYEIERKQLRGERQPMLRFRTQPFGGMVLILVSDVTAVDARRAHNRQVARLQLIGQIARGVAFDFNNMLCAIAGHASLLTRLPPDSPDVRHSQTAIRKAAERGTALAAHLLELSTLQAGPTGETFNTEFLDAAVSSLSDSLPEEWRVESDIQPMPPVSLSGIKIEQVVVNLGLLAAERAARPGILRIVAGLPDPRQPLMNVDENHVGVLVISTASPGASLTLADDSGQTGVIESVIRSMIEEAGGALTALQTADGLAYRVGLPRQAPAEVTGDYAASAADLGPYVANWAVLFASATNRNHRVYEHIKAIAPRTQRVDNVASALAHVEEDTYDAVIVDAALMGAEIRGLLRALVKLSPASALVVLGADVPSENDAFIRDIVFMNRTVSPSRVLLGLIEARSLAVRRRRA